jgi:hypothetical protein
MMSKKRNPSQRSTFFLVLLSLLFSLYAGSATAQSGYGFAHPSGYGIKIYKADFHEKLKQLPTGLCKKP